MSYLDRGRPRVTVRREAGTTRASEIATATDDISAKVTAMRGDTGGASEAIGRITDFIARIYEINAVAFGG